MLQQVFLLAFLLQVVTAAGVTKNGEWIAELHEDLADELTSWQKEKLLGFLMDNTEANRKAMRLMGESFPHWLLLGCQSHAGSLLLKDFASPAKCP